MLTDYEQLMKEKRLWREEARLIVRVEVADIVRSWSRKKRRRRRPADSAELKRTQARNGRRKRAAARRRAQEMAARGDEQPSGERP